MDKELFDELYNKFCKDCPNACICHKNCNEFDDTCINIDEVNNYIENKGE